MKYGSGIGLTMKYGGEISTNQVNFSGTKYNFLGEGILDFFL